MNSLKKYGSDNRAIGICDHATDFVFTFVLNNVTTISMTKCTSAKCRFPSLFNVTTCACDCNSPNGYLFTATYSENLICLNRILNCRI